MIFQRSIEKSIRDRLFKGRAILLFGPRQAGKTTLSKKILSDFGKEGEYFNCEFADVRKSFVLGYPEYIRELVGKKKIVVFDEAQTIQDIGSILKTFIDTYHDIQIIATGSSSFDLANKINEPLTGRTFEFTLLPLSLEEIRQNKRHLTKEDFHELLRLGSYPAVISENDREIREDILKNLATNYLYKDIYAFETLRNPRAFEDLVKLLALQVGSLVSFNELAQSLGLARLTVEKYVRLLEQAYVIKIIRSFSRNPRTEIKKAFKVFFYDCGVRNAVLGDISEVSEREDIGGIFENFCISEQIKISFASRQGSNVMFWRNRQGSEVDIVETNGSHIQAYECKWSEKKIQKNGQFLRAYPESSFEVITPDSFIEDL
jgi:predicted AAA+ superfamily ATPase